MLGVAGYSIPFKFIIGSKGHGVKVGPGPWDLGPQDSGTRDPGPQDPLQSLKVGPS